MGHELRIGEVATSSGVSIDTVRYYERRKLLATAPRTASGYRMFSFETVERVRFIKQAQDLGFSLDDIGTLFSTNGNSDCLHVHDMLDEKLKELDARMKAMQMFREKLTHYLAECKEELKIHPDSAECPVAVEIAHAERK